jgi:hypothetical protein
MLARLGAVCFLALTVLLHGASLLGEEFRLRLSWGGKTRQWYGSVWLSEGSIEDPEPIGVEPDEPGSMWLDNGRLVIRQRSARSYDAVDLLVRAPRSARLTVQLTAVGDEPSDRAIEVPLEVILRDTFGTSLDAQGSRLRIARKPGDLLPIQLDSPSLVFAPGDRLAFRLDTTRLNVAPSEKIRFVAQLKNPYAAKPVWQSEVKPVWESEQTVTAGEIKALSWEVPLDVGEGVYQLTITATQPGWLSLPQVEAPLVGSRSHASRMIELVVLDSERPKIPTGTLGDLKSMKVVEEIDPTHPEWWKRFANLPQLPRLRRLWNGPLGNMRSEIVTHSSLGPVVRLGPNEGRDDLSWEAYTIPIKEPGRPHLLEVRYPSDRPQTFGVSVVEPNESGAAQLANLDTGVDQFEEVVSGDHVPAWRNHRVVFWPKTKTPIVLVTNRRDHDPAYYGSIRVSSIGDHLPRAYPAGGPAPARLFAAYLDRPLFPESFSAEEVFVASSQLGMDDWKTFYQGGTRLVEYLNHVGYGGLFLSVYADGSTIYPSGLLQPTTRYDTGAYLETGQDPERKDVLEMLFRLFDREGLKLIPALEFATPLPDLEAILREGEADTQGMVWVGRDGRSWPQVHQSCQGRAPYYNILDGRVQEAMLDVLRELVKRYSHHPSFAGVAIQLSADGYAQLPARSVDSAWGLDDDTIGRFQAATGIKISAEGPNRFDERFRQLASPQVESGWLTWRAEQVAAFYRRAYQELTAQRPDTRLYLAGARMFDGDAMQQQLRPSLPRRLTLVRTMKQVGIDPQLFSDPEGPVLLFGETVLPWTSLANQSVSLELESMRKAEDLASSYGAIGTLFYHQPQETWLASFDRISPFQPSRTRLTTQAVPSAAQNRRRLVRALAHFDPAIAVDGSLRIPLGQEDSLRDLIMLYRQLPAARFSTTKPKVTSEPLTVRFLQHADATYLLVINEAGFPVTASIRLRTPNGCRLEELTGVRPVPPLRADAEGGYWDIQLDAYDAIGAWLPSRHVEITKASARWSPEIDRALEARVSELESRRVALSRSREWGELENPGFEADVLDAGQIPGWSFRRGSEANVQVDGSQCRNGKASLRLVSTGQPTSVMSFAFKAPKTGRLTIKMWVRSGRPGPGLPLQIGVLGVHHGKTFYCAGVVRDIGDDWSQVSVDVPDVPEEGLNELQLHFQLTGPGEIWIDDVQLEDLDFKPQEQIALVKTVYPARATLADGQVTQCIRILESYWPRFLLQHVPPIEETRPAVARAPEQPASPPGPKGEEKKESGKFLGRIRDLVPERLRF